MNKLNISTYEILKKKVRETLLLGRQRIEEEKVRTYWRTGKLIHEHILAHQDRADYGAKVIERLSDDLDVSETVLQRTVKFYRQFPQIPARGPELKWSHIRALIAIPDGKTRLQLAKQAKKWDWTADELRDKIRKSQATEAYARKSDKPLEAPALGPFWTYQIKDSESIHAKRPSVLWVDLGFQTYLEAERFESYRLKAGSIVTSVKDQNKIYTLNTVAVIPINSVAPARSSVIPSHPPVIPAKAGIQFPENHLYTYQAYVERVIDADTMKVQIDLGFDTWTRQTLRLRGIDAFEVDTKEGKRAKAFVERELKSVPFVTLKSTRDDKYGRYLADVFYGKDQYLNQLLLDHKFAVKV